MEENRRRYGSRDYVAAQGVMRQVLVKVVNERYEETLSRIACPTIFVWGADDRTAPVERAREASTLVAGSKVIEIPGAGHLTPLSAPAALRSAVEEVLSSAGTNHLKS